ncbi:MAG: carboxyl transferase domain-containing protein [Terracoccus sp.]
MSEPATAKPVRLAARELLDTVLDEGTWRGWDEPAHAPADASPAYAAELAAARERSGCDESIITGEGRIRGRRVAIIAGEFRFLAGSIGAGAAERIVLAFERAVREELPVFAAPSSGGTRMQEGTPAFVGMVAISAACAQLKAAGLPYLVYLRHPTTGGVFASWGSLGQVTVAEPGAMIGFLGARVYEALYGTPFPEGVQTAENLFEHGLIDAILPVEALAETADRALNVLMGPREDLPDVPELVREALPDLPAWDSIVRSRRDDRPGVRALLRHGATDVLPLHGTGQGEYDPGMLMALARFGGAPCIVLGQDRRGQTLDEPLSPKGLRVARRGMALARELGLPLVSVIDTAGAALSKEAEEGGLAGEIARCLAELVTLEAPTLCVLLGQGTGGGALAVMPADRVICAQHSWLSPLPPEGASAILHRDTAHAPELAASQRVRSLDLLADGIVDRIVAEHPDAADEPEDFCRRMSQTIQHDLAVLARQQPADRIAARLDRYRRLAGLGARARD